MRLKMVSFPALKLYVDTDPRTQAEIAEAAGLDRTLFNKFYNGEREPSEDQIRAMGRALGVHPGRLTDEIPRDELIGWLETRTKGDLKLAREQMARVTGGNPRPHNVPRLVIPEIPPEAGDVRELPIFGNIAAGRPLDINHQQVEAWARVPDKALKGSSTWFCLTVKGDSMELANLHEGSIVVCEATHDPQPDTAVVASVWGETTVKVLEQRDDGVWLVPSCENPERYPAIKVEPDAVIVQATVRFVMHPHRLPKGRRKNP